MRNLLIILSFMGLVGCSSYGTSFDCPMPKNTVSCKPVSQVDKEFSNYEEKERIIYLGGV